MLRLVLGVVTGYVLVAVSSALLFQLTGQDPHAAPSLGFGITTIVWMAWSAALAGYVTSRIAHQATLVPSLVMGCLLAIALLWSLISEGVHWPKIVSCLLMAPSAIAGGLISTTKTRKPA